MRIIDWSSDVCSSDLGLGENGGFAPVGLRRGECWQGAGPIRDIFRKAFAAAGLPYFNPHSLRDTLVQLGEQVCTTPEQFKAWSQNLGHERVMTTLTSYGTVAPHRQAELIRGMGTSSEEHTSELQSLMRTSYAVFCLKKKNEN